MPPPIAPEIVVAPAAAKAPRHSLLRVGADLLNMDGDSTEIRSDLGDRWEAGVTWLPEGCDEGSIWIPCCSDDVPDSVVPDSVIVIPGVAMATFKCSTFSRGALDYRGRARRKLQAVASHHLATEFWRGDAAIECDLPNDWLANPDTVTIVNSGAVSTPLLYALGLLQDALADCLNGGFGVIHAKRSLVNLWASASVIEKRIDSDTGTIRFFDMFDNEIIADSGYDGSATDGTIDETGDTQWVYATGIVGVASGNIIVNPPTEAEAVDRATNLVTYTAQQTVVAGFDNCCHFGINVSVCSTDCPDPLIEPTSA